MHHSLGWAFTVIVSFIALTPCSILLDKMGNEP